MRGDLPVGHAARDEHQDFVLARGEVVQDGRVARHAGALRLVAEGGDETCGDRGRDHAVAGGDDADAGDKVGGRRALEQKAAGAGLEALIDVFVQVEGREDKDARGLVAPQRDNGARRLDPVHHRHLHVHQHDVGIQAARQLQRLAAVAGFAVRARLPLHKEGT